MLFQSWRKYSGDAISFFSFLKTELLKKIFSKTSVTFISFGVNNFQLLIFWAIILIGSFKYLDSLSCNLI